MVRNQWIVDVLFDLASFAQANRMFEVATVIRAAQEFTSIELVRLASDEGKESKSFDRLPSDQAKLKPGL